MTIRRTLVLLAALSVLAPGGCVVYRSRMTFSGLLGQDVQEVRVCLEGRQSLANRWNRVYYEEPDEAAAELAPRVLAVLTQQQQMLSALLGVSPGYFGAAIVQKADHPARYVIADQVPGWTVWVLELADTSALSLAGEIDDLYHTMMHERTEEAVIRALGADRRELYDLNGRTRWIGDGLAEYAGWRFARQHEPAAALYWLANRRESLREAMDEWHCASFDLRRFEALRGRAAQVRRQVAMWRRHVDVIGGSYAASFYYWAALAQARGDGAARQVLAAIRRRPGRTDEDIDAAIREVAGPEWVLRVGRVDAAEVLAFLDGAIRELIPQVVDGLRSAGRWERMARYEVLDRLDEDAFPVELSWVPTTAMVQDVLPGSPAWEAQLRPLDLIESVNDVMIQRFRGPLLKLPEGRGVPRLTIRRRGREILTVPVPSLAGCRLARVAR